MNGVGVWGVGAWVIAGAVALAGALIVPVVEPAPAAVPRRPPPPFAVLRPYAADSLARVATSRDLFRAARRPAPVAYDPQRAAAPVVSQQIPKPALLLVGIVAGPEPTAVIEGFPSIEGPRVVRVGDHVSAIRVVRIAADHVRLVGMDTTWVLRVREPWK